VRIPSVASREFWRAYRRLPRDVRTAATRAYRLWQQDAFHPSLHFKKVGADLWSVRVGIHHRAVGTFLGDRLVWSWIGTHADYDTLLG
jgi:hypothetical protein